jgi:hypothetical protein
MLMNSNLTHLCQTADVSKDVNCFFGLQDHTVILVWRHSFLQYFTYELRLQFMTKVLKFNAPEFT